MENNVGITNLIILDSESDKAIQHIRGIENLDIITSGAIPPDPSKLFTSNKLKVFLENIKEIYDYILIDSPPVNIVSDAVMMATMVDGVILLCESGRTKIDLLKTSKEKLENVKANILGTILTKVKSKTTHYYYYDAYRDVDKKNSKKRKK